MKTKIEGGVQAFSHQCDQSNGISLRDWFAGQALSGLCANGRWDDSFTAPGASANKAYAIADAMLAERKLGA